MSSIRKIIPVALAVICVILAILILHELVTRRGREDRKQPPAPTSSPAAGPALTIPASPEGARR